MTGSALPNDGQIDMAARVLARIPRAWAFCAREEESALRQLCDRIVDQLSPYDPAIVSRLEGSGRDSGQLAASVEILSQLLAAQKATARDLVALLSAAEGTRRATARVLLLLRAAVLQERTSYPQALDTYDKVLRLSTDDGVALYESAVSLHLSGRGDDALRRLRRLAKLIVTINQSPDAAAQRLLKERLNDNVTADARGITLLVRAAERMAAHQFAEAEQPIRDAQPLVKGAWAAKAGLMLGTTLISLGREDEARAPLDAAAALADDDPLGGEIALYRAKAWRKDGEVFRRELQRADKLLPVDTPLRDSLRFLQSNLWDDDPELALKRLDDIQAPPPDWHLSMTINRADALAARGQLDDASATLEPLLTGPDAASEPVRSWTLTRRARIFIQAGRASDALEILSALPDTVLENEKSLQEEVDGLRAGALIQPAVLMLQDGQLADGVAALSQLADPRDTESWVEWAVAAHARSVAQRADTAEAIERSTTLNPAAAGNPLVAMPRALLAGQAGDVATVDAAREAFTAAGAATQFHALRAQALLLSHAPTDAVIRELEETTDQAATTNTVITRTLGMTALGQEAVLLTKENKLDEAVKATARARADFGASDATGIGAATVSLADGLIHMARHENAAADSCFERAVLPDALPLSSESGFYLYYIRGVNWLNAGREQAEDALKYLKQAADIHDDDVGVLQAICRTYFLLEDSVAALEACSRALGLVSSAEQRIELLLDKSAALRELRRLTEALNTAREVLKLAPADARGWLSVGACQLDLARLRPAAIAFRRGWDVEPPSSDEVATQLLLGLTKALIDGDHASDALTVLDEPRAKQLAHQEPDVHLNRAVTLIRLDRRYEAATALDLANRRDLGRQLRDVHAKDGSWVGFWFGNRARPGRIAAGTALIVAATLALVPVIVDAQTSSWLHWSAKDNLRTVLPLATIAVLFLLPVVTRLKVGEVEIEQPAPAAPSVPAIEPVSWDVVGHMARSWLVATPTVPLLGAGNLKPTRSPELRGT